MVVGCYVTYKEAKHHELHKLRACFIDIEEYIKKLETLPQAERDPETLEIFKGEIIGIEKVIAEIDKEDADCDLIREINEDLAKIKEKVASLFNK